MPTDAKDSRPLPVTARRRHRWKRQIKPSEAVNAIFLDFEGRRNEPPALAGVLLRAGDDWALRQVAFDPALQLAAASTTHGVETGDLLSFARWLSAESERGRRHVVAWSEYDITMLLSSDPGLTLRFRNARASAARWAKRQGEDIPGDLQSHLDFVGFHRATEIVSGAATWIRTIRERTAGKSSWADVSPGARRAWDLLVAHNASDLYGMKAVVEATCGNTTKRPL